ncbi:MAG: 3-dehydroquinate synthase [Cyanobacteriota bacterium]|jgi:3-dehydroquinate synthase
MTCVIDVPLPHSPYQVRIAPGSLPELGAELSRLGLDAKVLVVSNPEIFEHYGPLVLASLRRWGFQPEVHLIPAGEGSKTLAMVSELYDAALALRLERRSTFLALGGGVVGDLTGFAAATWLRGVNFVQVPTSLLAMVDASIGGKTGVNHPQGKNLIGAFYQPRLVYIDPLVLKTLPEREFRAGMAEVIKYGVIWDPDLFAALASEDNLSSLETIPPALLTTLIQRSCQAKVDVVSQDEREGGLRAILNYGHTLGHGVESLTGYGPVNHGEAVAIGMVGAGALAVKLGLWTEAEDRRQLALLEKTGLPTCLPESIDIPELIASLHLDKKVQGGKVRFILPEIIGRVKITDQVGAEVLAAVLESMR